MIEAGGCAELCGAVCGARRGCGAGGCRGDMRGVCWGVGEVGKLGPLYTVKYIDGSVPFEAGIFPF